jgi:uncharacterized protein
LADEPADFSARVLDLWGRIAAMSQPILAFSGGVDSSLVAAVLAHTHDQGCLLVTADSPSLSQRQRRIAAQVAGELRLPHRWLATQEAEDPGYQQNHRDRCYYCKSHLYGTLRQIAAQYPGATLLSGTNLDDLGDHRPGLRAAAESGIAAPLAQASMSKADVRRLAARLGLSVHDLPAAPCLASRLAYGVRVTPARLRWVEAAETLLWDAGFSDVRVRLLPGEVARVEVPLAEVPRLCPATDRGPAAEPPTLLRQIRALGFADVIVDPLGLRSGNLNTLDSPKLPQLPILTGGN